MKATQMLHDLGQSLWLDNITRDLLDSGTLKRYIDELSVTGLTSNPTIFDHAIKNSVSYDAAIRQKVKEGKAGEPLFFELALEDLTRAADLFRPIWDKSNGVDGWVSLEVSPLLAYDTASTLAAARELGAIAVRYPKPVAEYEASPPPDAAALGIRIGIIAREETGDAWTAARARFPEERKGQLTHQLAMKVSDSEWHKQLSKLGETATAEDQPYWMAPFENYKTFCPYLVGSYDRVADEIARYVGVGYRTIILDVPASPEELEHIGVVCERAAERVTS